MTRLLIGSAIAALGLAIAPAMAQVAPPPGVAQGTSPAPMARPMIRPAPQAHMRMMIMRHPMTRAEVAEHVAKMFAMMDTNHDGYLTHAEVDAGHARMRAMRGDMMKRPGGPDGLGHAMPPMDRGAMFDRLDTNHDGSISRQEYLAARPEIRERRIIVMRDGDRAGAPGMPPLPGGAGKMRMHGMGMGMGMGGRMFEMADTNHDGRVSLAEAQAMALAHFDRADADRDGKVTPDERKHARAMRMERRGN